jgi:sugar lactone lactonase YvrE
MKKILIKIARILFLRIVPVILGIVVVGLIVVKIKYGTGKTYTDIGTENPGGNKHLEKLIKLDYPPGNVAIDKNGHVYFNYHPVSHPKRFSNATVFEWADGKITPFPSAEMQKNFQGTFGLTVDKQNHLWLVEPATFDFKHTRVWAFDLATKKIFHYYEFPEGVAQMAEDIRVTGDGKYVIFPNPGIFRFTNSQLLVYSVDDHSVRTVLDGEPSVSAEDWTMRIKGKPYRLFYGLLNFSVGIDGIQISDDQKWLYIAPMTNSQLYRVPLADVLNKDLTPKDVAAKMEDLGAKPMSDGITLDKKGNVIITDVEHGGLMSFDPATKKITTLVRNKKIVWADGVVVGADNTIYFNDSSIPTYIGQFAAPPDIKLLLQHKPYYIYRLKQ